jgi:hypothetical protein
MTSSLLLTLLGCIPDSGHPAPQSAEIASSVPQIDVALPPAVNGNEGIGVLMALDWLVVDTARPSGGGNMPLANIEFEVFSGSPGLILLPEAAIREVTPPDNSGEPCDPNDAANYNAEVCPWYDQETNTYYELQWGWDGQYRPNYGTTKTDRFGVARMWLFIDSVAAGTDAGVTGQITADSVITVVSNQADEEEEGGGDTGG